VLCDVIGVVTEFMVRMQSPVRWMPSVLCDVIGVVTEFMVRMQSARTAGAFSVATECTASTPERNVIGHTHASASSGGAKA
jgi:hypothetical protein